MFFYVGIIFQLYTRHGEISIAVTGIAVVLQDGLDVRSKLHIHRIARIATIIPTVVSVIFI
jgi:hypothetical protein